VARIKSRCDAGVEGIRMPPSPTGIELRETIRFRRWVRKAKVSRLLDDLVPILMTDPNSGDVIPGSGGIRKVRMAGHGKGKRGGFRVVYTVLIDSTLLRLLSGYSKSEKEDVSADEIAGMRKEATETEAAVRAEREAARKNSPEV